MWSHRIFQVLVKWLSLLTIKQQRKQFNVHCHRSASSTGERYTYCYICVKSLEKQMFHHHLMPVFEFRQFETILLHVRMHISRCLYQWTFLVDARLRDFCNSISVGPYFLHLQRIYNVANLW